MKMQIFCLLSCLSFHYANAQYQETIASDRPGQAVSPFVTGNRVFQLQSGVNIGKNSVDGALVTAHIDNTTNLRFGVARFFELQSTISFRNEKDKFEPHLDGSGLSGWNLGLRMNFLDGTGSAGALGLIWTAQLDWVSKDFKQNDRGSSILLLHSIPINEVVSLNTNLGISTASLSQFKNNLSGLYVVNIGFSISKKIGAFLEIYGDFDAETLNNKMDLGLAYLINNDLQLDISGGYELNKENVQRLFIDLGVSWRVKFEKPE